MIPTRPASHFAWLPNSMLWLDLINPDYTAVTPLDLVHPMSRIMRFTAQLPMDVPLADASLLVHSWFVADIMEQVLNVTDERMLRTGLLHDAHEVLVQDASNPLKIAMRQHDPVARMFGVHRSDYDVIEERHKEALAKRFDLIYPHPPAVAEADKLALACEMVMWFGHEWYEAEGESCGIAGRVPMSVIRYRKQCTIEDFLALIGEPPCIGCKP